MAEYLEGQKSVHDNDHGWLLAGILMRMKNGRQNEHIGHQMDGPANGLDW